LVKVLIVRKRSLQLVDVIAHRIGIFG
jgi:hypothetical protein